ALSVRWLGGERAQISSGTLVVLTQVEGPGPERRAIWRSVDAGHVRQALERPHEHGKLEVHLRDARRAGGDARARQDRLPLEQLAGAGTAVPGASLRAVGLQLEQVAVERTVEPGERRLGPVCGMPERGLTPAGGGGIRIPAGPALEQPAEGERSRLAGAELAHEPPRSRPLGRVVFQHVGPAGPSGANG